eukprot:gnl/Chilomastix_caulleri/2587.p2 GENE.gnl/Chilomastix_caulleri/2587~~gnl/Chilomastix_caulleri/2587.p2  ORF type:complete len:71 (-),score=9.96 gnl/Chilomastix_caulleri/2587:227-439(-)
MEIYCEVGNGEYYMEMMAATFFGWNCEICRRHLLVVVFPLTDTMYAVGSVMPFIWGLMTDSMDGSWLDHD